MQPNKNSTEYNPALINLQPASGLLSITTTGNSSAGGPWEGDNTLVDGLQTQFNATTGAFSITTRLKGPLSFMNAASDQGGLMFGPDDDNYVKFVAEASPTQTLQFIDEQHPAGATSYTHAIPQAQIRTPASAASRTSTRSICGFRPIPFPASSTVIGFYSVNGGTFVQVAQQLALTGTEKTAFFSSAARAGIFAMAKNNNPPITVGFQDFNIQTVAGSSSSAGGKLAGTIIGTAGSYKSDGNTIAKAFDGNLNTFYDGSTANGNWLGLDLGAPSNIAQVKYSPRSGWAARMVGGIFQGSSTADFSAGVVNLFTITATPASQCIS